MRDFPEKRGKSTIHFRCWYCNRRYAKPTARIGEHFTCSCERVLRVPKRDGGKCRVKTIADWVVETTGSAGWCATA